MKPIITLMNRVRIRSVVNSITHVPSKLNKMNKDKIFLIQGVYTYVDFTFDPELDFENVLANLIDNEDELETWLKSIIEPIVLVAEYYGFIKFIGDDRKNGIGLIMDQFGQAVISSVNMTEESLRFCKKYDDRDDLVVYEFEKYGNHWNGSYSGSAAGYGLSECVVHFTDELGPIPKPVLALINKDNN